MSPETVIEKIEALIKWDLHSMTTVSRIQTLIEEYRSQFDPDYNEDTVCGAD